MGTTLLGGLALLGFSLVVLAQPSAAVLDGSDEAAHREFAAQGIASVQRGIWTPLTPASGAPPAGWPSSISVGSAPQVTGLWFDPATPGQGFNLQVIEGGLFGFYYGYRDGDPLWLIFDVHFGSVTFGESLLLTARVPQEGVFGNPLPPDQGGIGEWGTLELRFDSCTQAHARLDGLSGTQEFELVLLAGIHGVDTSDCEGAVAATPLGDVTGAWFDPATAGQGWNFVQTSAGVVGFFYGYDQAGAPLWLITEQVLEVELGVAQLFDLHYGQGGDFDSPVPPQQLQHWGVVELELESCRNGVARISGADGEQEQPLQMLVGVPGIPACAESLRHGWMNDSGIQFCGGANSGNFAPCTSGQPAGQDATIGRDALAAAGELEKVGGGNAGFDFTRIANSGEPASGDVQLGPGIDDWACTRDNVTGLLWEIKVNEPGHPRHWLHEYTWFDPDSGDAGTGAVGTTGSCDNSLAGQPCNTHNFVQSVRASGLCGRNDWRMPTRHELESIMDYGRTFPSIDTNYFTNTPGTMFWTGSPRANSATDAWAAFFDLGGIDYVARSSANKVRLVSDSGVQR